jgi:hypothetical protein
VLTHEENLAELVAQLTADPDETPTLVIEGYYSGIVLELADVCREERGGRSVVVAKVARP